MSRVAVAVSGQPIAWRGHVPVAVMVVPAQVSVGVVSAGSGAGASQGGISMAVTT